MKLGISLQPIALLCFRLSLYSLTILVCVIGSENDLSFDSGFYPFISF